MFKSINFLKLKRQFYFLIVFRNIFLLIFTTFLKLYIFLTPKFNLNFKIKKYIINLGI